MFEKTFVIDKDICLVILVIKRVYMIMIKFDRSSLDNGTLKNICFLVRLCKKK